MKSKIAKYYVVLLAIVTVTAVTLSLLAHVPYIYTLIGFSAWALFGHIITADDDTPGGWSNPDGKKPFPWGELAIKLAVFVVLWAVVFLFPQIRILGR